MEKKILKNGGKKKTQECLNNIRIRFPMLENECYAKRTRILRTMVGIMSIGKDICKSKVW